MNDRKPYDKPFLTFQQQVALLKERGLIIDNEEKALHLLEKISYFRLSGYWYPLLEDKENHIFKEGANFQSAFSIYCFDKQLRKLIFSELEKIEVGVRSSMIHTISQVHGPFWIEMEDLSPDKKGYSEVFGKLTKEYERCKELFIDSFKSHYTNQYPPCWMFLEIASFGTLSSLYKYLKPSRMKRQIANAFNVDETTFESWLHSIVYVRNLCAHHSRLWNRKFTIKPALLHRPKDIWLEEETVSNARLFYFASVMVYMLNSVNPKHTFKEKLIALLNNYETVDPKAMGFYKGWEAEPLWNVLAP